MFARLSTRLEPFHGLSNDLDRLFGHVFEDLPRIKAGCSVAAAVPRIDVWEDEESVFAEADLPGFQMADIEVTVIGNELTLKGERKEDDANRGGYHRKERGVGAFTRVLQLPIDIDTEKVEATLRSGVLLIKLPKSAAARPHKIEVKALPN